MSRPIALFGAPERRGRPASRAAVPRVYPESKALSHAAIPQLARGPVRSETERAEDGAAQGLAPWKGSRVAANVPAWPAAIVKPRRSLRCWIGGSSTLTLALVLSVLLHALVLAIHFRPFDPSRMLDQGAALTVALVNARSASKPATPELLAQANLDGGGNTEAARKAKTPLPVLPKEVVPQDVAVARTELNDLEREARDLLTRLQSVPSVPVAPAPEEAQPPAPAPTERPTTRELTQRALEAMRLEAQIAKEFDAYQKRPKRQFVGARAEEYRFARYVEDWRLKVERIGNLNYPSAARELKLYGSLLLTVSIRSDGSVESIEVHRSSGYPVLDAAAVKIVEMGAPYAPFPPDIRRDTDVLSISRTWTFARGDELRTD